MEAREVKLTRANGSVQISVSDTGQGISPEFLPFIFDRFVQADGTTTRHAWRLGVRTGYRAPPHRTFMRTVKAESSGAGLGARFIIQNSSSSKPAYRRSAQRSEKLVGNHNNVETASILPRLGV